MFVGNVNVPSLDKEQALEFFSPIGNVVKYSDGIVHVHITEMTLNKSTLEGHYAILEENLGAPKHPFILTFKPNYLKMDALSRRYNNDEMNRWSTAMAVVVENPLIRAFVMMYMRINPLFYNIKICVSLDEAFNWLRENQLAEV